MMESKFIKRINVNRHRLSKEIGKINEAEKSEIKMMDACRRKFRMKHKKLGFSSTSTTAYKATIADADDAYPRSSDDCVNDVRDETTSTKNDQESDYAYDVFRSLLFTDDEVDLNKILVLHLLTAHVAENSGEQLLTDISSSYATEKDLLNFLEKENKNTLNGPWNNILPCYIVKSQRDKLEFHNKRQKPEQVLHQQKDKFIRNSELDCNQLVEDCKESDYSVQTRNLLPYAEKVPTISSRMLNTSGGSYRNTDFKNIDEFSKALNNQKNLAKQRSIASFSNTSFCKNNIKTNRYKYIYCSSLPISKNLRNQKQNIVPVYVNNQLRNLIQDVMDSLQVINPEKIKNFFGVLENTQKISAVLKEPKVKLFLQSMRNYSLIFAPENYLIIPTIEIENNNSNLKTILNKHLIAETLEIQSFLDFDDLLTEIQTNLFFYQKILANNAKINDNSTEESKVQSIKNGTTNDYIINDSQLSVMKTSKNNLIGNCSGEVVSRMSKLSHSSHVSVIQSQIRKAHDFRTTDPDQIILRRMTNAQRILVGQMCASLKTKLINNEGFLKQRVPLISLLRPILSQESIRNLTEGTIYAQDEDEINQTEKMEKNNNYIVDGKLTKSIILKLRHEAAESETQQKLKDFMKKPI